MSNISIFNIFKGNKKIILFLIEQDLLTIDQHIAKIMQDDDFSEAKYPQYFFTELKQFLNNQQIYSISKEIPENFEELRKIGENSDKLCELIRNDSIEDFIIYVKKNGIVVTKSVEPSIFETNPLLLKNDNDNSSYGQYGYYKKSNKLTLIEYAAFFGSNQVFKYLNKNGCALTPQLWIYAIHGRDPEIIQILVDNKIQPQNDSYQESFIESIKCHHIEMTNYIQDNFLNEKTLNFSNKCIKYYNFAFIEIKEIDDLMFYKYKIYFVFFKLHYKIYLKIHEISFEFF